ncbi:response regulator [Candidatus Omnitrophota bacterium]
MKKGVPKNPRVLVAEDTELISKLMKVILLKNGFEVDVAHDGEQCLEKIETFKPDLVILDIMMPKIHGIDVLKKIRDEDEHIPGVIICTSKGYRTDLEQYQELGAFDVIVKPFLKDDFLNTVKKFFLGWVTPETTKKESAMSLPSGELFLPKIKSSRGHFHLWGTRGSIPVTGQQYIHHGGNTSCVSFECGDDILIFDAGTGIRDLGMTLKDKKPQKVHIFVSHTHWDHIQGFPFFAPAYTPGFKLIIYGASGFGKNLQSIFKGQLDSDYFPVQMEDMTADLEFKHLSENPLHIGDFTIHWEYTHHPGPTLGFKISLHDQTIGYITDNEFLKGYCGNPDIISTDSVMLKQYSPLIDFMSDIDLLIGEAQYTNEEYRDKIGWGHSSLSNACLLIRLAGIRRWIVNHHDPLHNDEFLQRKLNLARQIFLDMDYRIDVINGFDGLVEYV